METAYRNLQSSKNIINHFLKYVNIYSINLIKYYKYCWQTLLSIRGETKAEEEVKEEDYLYLEHWYGAFSRSVTFPCGLDTE